MDRYNRTVTVLDRLGIWIKEMALFLLCFCMLAQAGFASGSYLQTSDEDERHQPQLVANEPASNSQRKVSLKLHEVTLVSALQLLADEVNVGLALEVRHVPNKKVNADFENVSVFKALHTLLSGTGLEAVLPSSRDVLVIRRILDNKRVKQMETVRGTVTDAGTGETLPGVNVLVKGTTTGTSTDSEGGFELNVPSLQDTLVFSFIGYQTQEVPINGRTDIDVALQSQAISGEELVVVGYGTQRREDVVSGISTVNTDNLNLSDQNTPQAGDLLKGRVSGVRIQDGTGAAGSPPIIRVRGTSSVNAGVEPLIVVDGFPVGTGFPQTLNPDDIGSITVLKDAAATAIYGARGSNGVVLVETKNAASGMSEFTYSSSLLIKELPESWRPQMLNAEEAVQFNIERIRELDEFNNVSTPTPIPQRFLDAQEALERGELSPEGTDWLDEFIQEGRSSFSHNHNFNYRGGNENLRAFISGGYLEEKSLLPSDDFQRFSLRSNIDADLSESIQMGLNLNGMRTENNRIPSDGHRSGLWAAITGSPLISPYDEDGNLIPFVPGDAPGFFARPNPIFQAKEELDRVINRDLQANLDFDVGITDNLHYAPRIYVRQLTSETEQFQPTTIGQISIAGPGDLSRGGPPQNNNATNQIFKLENWGIDNILRYTRSMGAHDFNVTLGQTAQKETGVTDQMNGAIFPSDEIVNFAEAAELNGFSSDYEWSLLAVFGQIKYDYQDKYLAELNFRREGSSRLGANNRYGNFPSGALGWRISNENFYPDDAFIDEILLRGSYGKTGNNAIGNFDALGRLASVRAVFGDNVREAKSLSAISNEDLQWETAEQWQIGTTLRMLNNSITMEVEYWNKTTKNMLFNVNTPGASGFQSTRVNIGEMVNKGVDASINAFKDFNGGVQWNSNLNISWTTNEVTKMPAQIDRLRFGGRGGTNVVQVGDEVGALWGLVRVGLFNEETANDPNTANFAGLPKVPGTNHYKDLNGDGVIDRTNDMTVIGDPTPDVILGFNNQLSYRNFSFSVLLSSMLGYQIMPTIRDVDLNQVARWNVSTLVLDRWQSPENPGNGFVPRSEVNANSREWMDDWLEPGDHLWIKNIKLSYSLPSQISQKIGTSQVRFIFTIDNVARFDNYSGFNPEVSASSDPVQPGIDSYVNPLARSYSLGINLKF
ncbi:SusC/RagA family TonB-linked outer membrane protein [Halalkalibaculum sp. DA3122]|uniref:SusC/RagA family TonB-linked outer membrane protein n=1 Tax=unclassified Halalkalibaculum TaxID=2964617 RepID=UPI003754E619